MKFGEVPPGDAVGCVLAHTVRLTDVVVKKGTVISEDIIALMTANDVEAVMVARLEHGDVSEDDAAKRVAKAICGDGVADDVAFTGRVNIFAKQAGVFVATNQRIQDLNRVNEAMTVATLRPLSRVEQGQMVATVKIIPFSVPTEILSKLESAAAATAAAISVAPFQKLSVALVLTRLAVDKDKVVEKRRRAVADRVARLGGQLESVSQCAHNPDAVKAAILTARDQGHDLILLFGACAIVDRADVIPSALEAAGGAVIHLGMPVDPGNLLLYGRLFETPMIGVPSCASSIKENGFDWVLERVFADLPLDREDFISMAPGGLLKEIPSRPHPRETVRP